MYRGVLWLPLHTGLGRPSFDLMKSKRNYHHLTKMKIADTLWLFFTLWKIALSDIDDKNHRFTIDLPWIYH